MEREGDLRPLVGWRACRLTGNRRGTRSLTFTENWWLTFEIDREEVKVVDLDYEDYQGEAEMNSTHGIRLKKPPHPGGFFKHEIIEALDLSVTGAATARGVTRPALSAVLNEGAHLSPEMALRIEKAFGVSMDTLMRMQNSYDIAKARTRAGEIRVAPFERKASSQRCIESPDRLRDQVSCSQSEISKTSRLSAVLRSSRLSAKWKGRSPL